MQPNMEVEEEEVEDKANKDKEEDNVKWRQWVLQQNNNNNNNDAGTDKWCQ